MQRSWILQLGLLLLLFLLAHCGRQKSEGSLSVGGGAAAAQKCSAMRDFSVSVTPDRSVVLEDIFLTARDSSGATLKVARSQKSDFVSFTGKISASLQYQFRVTAKGKTLFQSEVINPKKEPQFQGCGISRNCSFENGKLNCATPV